MAEEAAQSAAAAAEQAVAAAGFQALTGKGLMLLLLLVGHACRWGIHRS